MRSEDGSGMIFVRFHYCVGRFKAVWEWGTSGISGQKSEWVDTGRVVACGLDEGSG